MGVNVQFTDRSKGGPTSWDWDFGDNTEHSQEQNPIHDYALYGDYFVTLVTGTGVGIRDSVTVKITVGSGPIPPPIASFSWTLDI